MNLHKKISLIKLEIIGSFILLILFLISQIHYNYFEIYDFIVILTFFISYYLLSFLEHIYKNIFLRLLNFFFILFFILRMSTIPFDFINDYSIFFSDRIHPSNLILNKFANTESITKYLIFLNLHYLSFGFSLLVLRPLNRKLDFNFININSIKLILLILLIQLLLLIINYIIFPVTNLPEQNVAIIKIFFHLFNLDKIYILLAFLLFLTWRLNYDFIIKKQIILILVPSILFPIFMFASKSSLLEFSLYLFLFQFLLQKDFVLKTKYLKYLVLYIVGIFLFFSIAKLSKIFIYSDAYSIANFFEENSKTAHSLFTNLRALQSVGYVFMERIGFFDYYLFTVSNEKYLSTLFVFENYIMRNGKFSDPILVHARYRAYFVSCRVGFRLSNVSSHAVPGARVVKPGGRPFSPWPSRFLRSVCCGQRTSSRNRIRPRPPDHARTVATAHATRDWASQTRSGSLT